MWLKAISVATEAAPELASVVVPVIVLVGGVYGWQKYAGVRLRLSLQRTVRLRNEMKGKPLGLQLDAALAFGAEIDNRVLELADTRENPTGLIRSYVRAQPLVRFIDDGFAEDGPPSVWSFKKRSTLALGAITAYFFATWVTAGIATSMKDPPKWFLLTVLSFMALLPVIGPLGAWLSVKYDHAHRLTKRLDELHPMRRAKPRSRKPKGSKDMSPSK